MPSLESAKSWIDFLLAIAAAVGGFVTVVAVGWRWIGRVVGACVVAIRIHSRFGADADAILHRTLESLELAANESSIRRNIIERHLGIGVYVCDASGKCTWVNDQLAISFGIDRASFSGFGWLSAIHPEDRGRVREKWVQATKDQLPYEEIYRVDNRQSGITWMARTEAWPVVMDDEVAAWVGCVMPIKEIETGSLAVGAPSDP